MKLTKLIHCVNYFWTELMSQFFFSRWRLKVYKNVFSGEQLVTWLIEVGLARDRIEAVNYARHLVEGKVLKHINGVYHFYDRNLLYCFV